MKHNPNGLILWEGASSIDGAPIVVIATGFARDSRNAKTGAQIQTWILRSDIAPNEALRTGDDQSVCGDCVHRPLLAGQLGAARCYVQVAWAPTTIWKAYRAGMYEHVNPRAVGYHLNEVKDWRFGAYGDPAAAPFWLWQDLAAEARSVTGYTHQWRTCDQRFAEVCMASVDSLAEREEATAMGWRTFRVSEPGETVSDGEAHCQASKEMGQKVQCADCRACGGTGSKARCGILIWDHDATGRADPRRGPVKA